MRNVVPTPAKTTTRSSYAQQFPQLPSYIVEPEEMRQQKRIEVEEEQKLQVEHHITKKDIDTMTASMAAATEQEEQKAAERSSEQATGEDNDKPEQQKVRKSSRSSRQRIVLGGMPVPAPPSAGGGTGVSRKTSSKLSASQQSILDESGKLLQVLRKEVCKLRGQNSQMRAEHESLKDSNQRLQEANAAAGNQFELLNQHAKLLNETNAKMADDLAKCRQQIQQLTMGNVELKEELKMKQATYVAEVQSRLHQQKIMAKVMDKLQEKCRDSRLVEEILTLVDDGESEYMSDPPATTTSFTSSTRMKKSMSMSFI